MKTFFNILVIILTVIIQTTIMPKLAIFNSYPNLIFLVMISLLFINRVEEALLWASIGGIILDIFSSEHFGIYMISLLGIFLAIHYFVKHVFSDPSVFLAGAIYLAASLFLNLVFLLNTHYYSLYLIEAIYSTFAGCIIYGLVRYYYKRKDEVKI